MTWSVASAYDYIKKGCLRSSGSSMVKFNEVIQRSRYLVGDKTILECQECMAQIKPNITVLFQRNIRTASQILYISPLNQRLAFAIIFIIKQTIFMIFRMIMTEVSSFGYAIYSSAGLHCHHCRPSEEYQACTNRLILPMMVVES